MRTVLDVERTDDEYESWLAAIAGDSAAFTSIFNRHGDRVYLHARRLTVSVADAEDLTAAAFFELWRRRRSVRVVNGSVLPWLLVTTTNLARNLARGVRRYRSMLAALPRSVEASSADELAERDLDGEAATDRVRQALSSLRPSDAALIVLTSFEHCSLTEAADALGISAGAARTRLHRARARMAASLDATEEQVVNEMAKGDNR
jgi:RNA polymerase sigma factor (sigma-70 family)